MTNKEDIVFSRNTVEFVTVAAEYCAYIERTNQLQRKEFVGTMLKLLPLLYIKAQMLPVDEPLNDEELEAFVTEDSYEVIRITLADLLAQYDTYELLFHSEEYPGFYYVLQYLKFQTPFTYTDGNQTVTEETGVVYDRVNGCFYPIGEILEEYFISASEK